MVNQSNLDLESASDEPLYNIGIASRMTGIPVATLRVWERRYGFPESTRTPGGHRLISEREVLRLRWVKARVDEGMQTGQAVHALRHLEQDGHLTDVPLVPAPSQLYVPVDDPSFSVFHDHLANMLMDHQLQRADQLLGEILSLYPLEELILEVVAPTLTTIGEAWHNGDISVATEHLATNFIRQHLLLWMMTGPQPFPNVPPVILACAPEEWHESSLLILGVLLRRLRWPVAYLGQNVPLQDLGVLIRDMKAQVIVFVAMSEETANHLLPWPEYLTANNGSRPFVGFGGSIFVHQPEWQDKMPGIYLGDSFRDGITRLDKLLHQTFRPGI